MITFQLNDWDIEWLNQQITRQLEFHQSKVNEAYANIDRLHTLRYGLEQAIELHEAQTED